MNPVIVLLFLVVFGYFVYYIIKLLISNRLTETFITNNLHQKMFFSDEHHTPYNKVNLHNRDAHWFLKKAYLPGKSSIRNLKEDSPYRTNYKYVDPSEKKLEGPDSKPVSSTCSKPSYTKIKDRLSCISDKHPLRKIVKKLQPYMYDDAEFVDHYDQPLYRDWRYQERPIDVRFAVNPQKYCEKNPNVYPCWKYFSKY